MDFFSAVSLYPPRAHLVLRGEFDAEAARQLRPRLDEAVASGCVDLTVDASEVTFVDAGGLGALVAVATAVRSLDGALRVDQASRFFRWVAGIAQLDVLFGRDADSAATSDLAPTPQVV